MTGMLQDLRYAVRQFLKTPGLTILVIVTIGLGVGANTALFSVVNGVLLSPLPYPEPDQLVALRESKPNFEWGTVPYPKFRDWQKDNHTFSKMAVWRSYAFSLTGVGEAEHGGEPGDLEQAQDARLGGRHHQPVPEPAVERDERAERGRVHESHVGQVQHHGRRTLVDDLVDRVAHEL